MMLKLLGSPLAVHKERAAGLYVVNDLVALEDVRGVVACNEICLVDVVGALYGLSPKRRWEMVMPPVFLESYWKYA